MAEYTIEFKDATRIHLEQELPLYEYVEDYAQEKLGNDLGMVFADYFYSRWAIYELFDIDTDKWLFQFKCRFNLLCQEYLEKINAYKTEIGVLDGIVIKRSTDNYDLPVQPVSDVVSRSTPVAGYPDRSYEAVVKGGQNTADVRNNYINKVRDIMTEFVSEFEPLFYTLF